MVSMSFKYKIFKNKKSDPDRDGGIGNIKSRPMVTTDIEFKEIDDKPVPDPVDQIADGPAGNQRERHCIQRTVSAKASLCQSDENKRRHGRADKEGLTPQGGLPGQYAESCAVIGKVGQIKKIRDNYLTLLQNKIMKDVEFRRLINPKDRQHHSEKQKHSHGLFSLPIAGQQRRNGHKGPDVPDPCPRKSQGSNNVRISYRAPVVPQS